MNGKNLVESLTNAKTAEEMKAALEELKDGEKLSMDDLDHVAGGAPETFMLQGTPMTQSELLNMINNVYNVLGPSDARSMLEQAVRPYYSGLERDSIWNAYVANGNNMFKALDALGNVH